MKKLFIVLSLSCLLACNGNESADSKPTDLDRTDNDDTSVKTNALPDSTQNNPDTTRL